jgi:pSer/pThr/pTyr-binding forkhead associated (FHA) protein
VRGEAPAAANLGPYAPLVAAIRDELEHFVVSYLRLHLTIAERDRYLLTSIEVRPTAQDDSAELLRRFIREFRPEQIKEYLAKEVIGALPNAAAIDLSQFAGLNAASGDEDSDEDDKYSELLAELRSTKPSPVARPYEVNLIGRWSEVGPVGSAARAHAPPTPLAGRNVELAIEDADGSRHVVLRSVVPGRRYTIGKGEGSDVAVNGVYASRRHCEIWFDHGAWWVTDAGSTNGIRVERGASVLGRSASSAKQGSEPAVVEITDGARVVLSAYADGDPANYPRLMLNAGRDAISATPIAPAVRPQATPSTPIVAARRRDSGWSIAVRMASGVRTVELDAQELPFSIGRSRDQGLAIDWAHEGVSGHHVDITAIDESGVTVVVHGDNGIRLAGTSYPAGARMHWKSGESIALGRVIGREPECELTLSHRVSD